MLISTGCIGSYKSTTIRSRRFLINCRNRHKTVVNIMIRSRMAAIVNRIDGVVVSERGDRGF